MKPKPTVTLVSLGIILALAAAIFLSPGSRAASPHMLDLNNLRQIAVGLSFYANEFNGDYPESLSEAFNPEDGVFTEGSYREIIFSSSRNSPEEVTVSDIDNKTDWIYVRGHTVSSTPDLIVLFTPAGRFKNFTEGEMLVAEIGGRALIIEKEEFIKSMNRTLAYLNSSPLHSEPGAGINSESLRSSP